MPEHAIAVLSASPPRRFIGVGMLAILGGLLVYMAFTIPMGLTQTVLIVFGIIALIAAQRMWAATAQVLVLRADGLWIDGGRQLAAVQDMQRVERGTFAFKPSNGFLLTLQTPVTRAWSPGLFWALGRRIGVGGVTGAPQSKALAEAISALIAEQGGTV